MTSMELKRSPLYEKHVSAGAKIVPFAGWEMPLQYTGLIEEHTTVRQAAGLFDVSHMGEIIVRGHGAEAALESMTCNCVASLKEGCAHYNAIINPRGGVVDDIIIYKKGRDDFFVCVNASNTAKDYEWFREHNRFDAEIVNESSRYGQIALQGPRARDIMDKVVGEAFSAALSYFTYCDKQIDDISVMIARTGYTGEDGFEIFIPLEKTAYFWDLLLEVSKPFGLVPGGLGARDTLRLEACYPLYGHELGDEISAIESGLGWIVKPEKGDFIGKEVLAVEKANGAKRSLCAFYVDDPGIVREHTPLFDTSGVEIGYVTSGTKTPTINKALGLALLKSNYRKIGTKFFADVRGRKLACHVVEKPFYKTATPPPSAR